MKFLLRLFILALAVVVIVFTVNNVERVAIDLWPALQETVVIPVWALAWLCIVVGLVIGYLVSWYSAGSARQRSRNLQRRLENAHREMAIMRKQIAKFEAAEREAKIPLPPAKAA